jgi:hypothetical protein
MADKGPIWRIRGMTAAEPDAVSAVAAAKRAGMPVAEWMRLAIREMVARERIDQGEVLLPGEADLVPERATPSLGPADIIAYLEAYRRVLELRGKRLAQNARILVAAERLLRAPFVAERSRLPAQRERVTDQSEAAPSGGE